MKSLKRFRKAKKVDDPAGPSLAPPPKVSEKKTPASSKPSIVTGLNLARKVHSQKYCHLKI
jgi:hypothetical protein